MSNQQSRKAARVIAVVTIAAGMAVSTQQAIAKNRYHVSYLWHHDLHNVQDYRRKVGRLLGRSVARNLKVIAKGDLFGLIYWRSGGAAGAAKTAKSHTRLLRRARLNAAAPVREDNRWTMPESRQRATRNIPDSADRKSAPKSERAARIDDIESAVAAYIRLQRQRGRLAADERTGWSVYDFTTGEKLVTINEDAPFQAASLVKPFIAVAFFHRVRRGDFIYGPKSRRHMERMIHWSDNRSTNWVMRQVGGPKAVQRILRANYASIFEDTHIVEYIPANGKTYRNKASVHDYSRFLYALWNKKIPGAREIQRLMALPGRNRIVTGARDIPKETKVLNKTGSTARLCGDMGILVVKGPDGKSYPYTVAGVIEKQSPARNYTSWIRSRSDIIRDVSSLVYKGIRQHHAFGAHL